MRRTVCQPDLVFLNIYMDGKTGLTPQGCCGTRAIWAASFLRPLPHIFRKIQQNFTYTVRKKEFTIPCADIVFFETGRHTVILHTLSDTVSFTGNPASIVMEFGDTEAFLPIGGSYLINLNHITGQAADDLIMSDGTVVQIPLKKRGEIFSIVRPFLNRNPYTKDISS